jgi:predicted PurR-regulated permease PerM
MLAQVLERFVHFPARTVFTVLAIVISVAVVLEVIWTARHVLTWVLISLFLALALNPAVDWFQRHGLHRRGLAVGVTYLCVAIVITALGATFVPTLVHQVNSFVDKLPDYVDDLTSGRGRLGFLETKYHVVEKVREQVKSGGASRILGLSGTALAVTKGVINIVVGTVTIIFMTFFMLLEGPRWMDRIYGLLPAESQPRWRKVGADIYRTVGGYVTGNLLISLVAGISSTVVLLIMGVPYAVALGLIVAFLDLIPLAGATLAAIIVASVAFLHSLVAGIVVLVFFVVYQQVENHLLQPVVYGRTVQLSPLAVLIAVLIGADLAGVLGALAAIPVAGAIQVIVVDQLRYRREQLLVQTTAPPAGEAEAPAS